MSPAPTKIVKWSFPAFALIIGLLWYKRRRVDRADPGGITKAKCASKSQKISKEASPVKIKSEVYDIKLQIGETIVPSNTTSTPVQEIIRSPRKISENRDIPSRKSSLLSSSVHSSPPCKEQAWYQQESSSNKMDIQLGSNPKISNFEAVIKSRSSSLVENTDMGNGKVMKIFENLTEEEEQKTVCEAEQKSEDNGKIPENVECDSSGNDKASVTPTEDGKAQTQVLSERDSANHSPVSGVLDGSVTDEARSEGSTDSGKGGSIKGTAKDNTIPTVYEFAIPQNIVGRLIGCHGSFLQHIRSKTDAHIVLKRHPTSRNLKICAIEGCTDSINVALEIIRQKFPEKKYPQVTLEQINIVKNPQDNPWLTGIMQLSLVEGMNNDVLVCHIVKPNRFFVQLPTHPTYPSLRVLDENMTQLYNTIESPAVPEELNAGMIVVAKWYNRWVRLCIEQPDPQGERHLARFVDYGGYWYFSNSEMRKIRSDCLTLPFQATEIYLANVQPKGGEWNQEAYEVVRQMCCGIVGQAQIEGYINSNTYVNLYINIHKHGVISLADELIARGYAEPIALENIVPEEGISFPQVQ